MVSANGKPLLADFGLSLALNASMTFAAHTSTVKGSARWMSVELLSVRDDEVEDTSNDYGSPTQESDVWAFGMIIYVSIA